MTTETRPPDSSNRLFLFAVIGLIVIGLAAVAVIASTVGGDDETGPTAVPDVAQTAPISISGAGLAPLPDGVGLGTAENDPVVGTTAPTLTGTGFDGSTVTITADGRPKVIYFLTHWCSHCQAEVPLIEELIAAGRQPDGLDLYAVSTAVDLDGDNFPPQAWLDDEAFTPAVIRDDETSAAYLGFGGSGFPYAVYLDGEGNVVARTAGSLDGDTMARFWDLTAGTG